MVPKKHYRAYNQRDAACGLDTDSMSHWTGVWRRVDCEICLEDRPKPSIIDRTIKAAIRECGWTIIWLPLLAPVMAIFGPMVLILLGINLMACKIAYWAHDGYCLHCDTWLKFKEWASHTKSCAGENFK